VNVIIMVEWSRLGRGLPCLTQPKNRHSATYCNIETLSLPA